MLCNVDLKRIYYKIMNSQTNSKFFEESSKNWWLLRSKFPTKIYKIVIFQLVINKFSRSMVEKVWVIRGVSEKSWRYLRTNLMKEEHLFFLQKVIILAHSKIFNITRNRYLCIRNLERLLESIQPGKGVAISTYPKYYPNRAHGHIPPSYTFHWHTYQTCLCHRVSRQWLYPGGCSRLRILLLGSTACRRCSLL